MKIKTAIFEKILAYILVITIIICGILLGANAFYSTLALKGSVIHCTVGKRSQEISQKHEN